MFSSTNPRLPQSSTPSTKTRGDFPPPTSHHALSPPAAFSSAHSSHSTPAPLQPGIKARPAGDAGHAAANTKPRRKTLHTTAAVMDLPATDAAYKFTPRTSPRQPYLRCDEINRLILNSVYCTEPPAVQHLSHVVLQYASLFNRVNVATAIHVLAKVVCGSKGTVVEHTPSARRQPHAAESAQCGQVEVAKQLLDSCLLPLFHRKMLAMQPRDVASCVWALGRLDHYPGHAFMHDLLLHILQNGTDPGHAPSSTQFHARTGDFIRNASPQDWSMLTWGLARLQKAWSTPSVRSDPDQHPTPGAHQVQSSFGACNELDPLITLMPSSDVSAAAEQLPPWVQGHIHDTIEQHVSPAQLSALTHDVFTVVASVAIQELAHTVTHSGPTQSPHSATATNPSQHTAAGTATPAEFTGVQIHMLSHLLVNGAGRPSPSWESEADRMRLELTALLTPSSSSDTSSTHRSHSTEATSSSSSSSSSSMKPRELKRASKNGGRTFMPLTLSSLAYSYATVVHPDSARLVGRVCSVACEHVSMFTAAELADIMWAAASLQVPHIAFYKACLPQAAKLARTMQPQELATALWACARLGLQHPAFTSAAAKAAVQLQPNMSPRLMLRVTGTLAKLQCEDEAEMRRLLDGLLDVVDKLEPQELVHVMQACALLKLQHPVAPQAASRLLHSDRPTPLPLLVEAARAATRLNHKYVYPLLRAATSTAASQPQLLTPRLVTNLLWVAATCGGVRDPHNFFPSTRMALQRCIHHMHPVQISIVLAALAKMDHYDAALVTSLCEAARGSLGLDSSQACSLSESDSKAATSGSESMTARKERRVGKWNREREFDGEQAALALWALGHLRHNEPDVVAALMEVCHEEAKVVGHSRGSRGGGLWDRVADIMEGVAVNVGEEVGVAGPTHTQTAANNILRYGTTHEGGTSWESRTAPYAAESIGSTRVPVPEGTECESESRAWFNLAGEWNGLRIVRPDRPNQSGLSTSHTHDSQVLLHTNRTHLPVDAKPNLALSGHLDNNRTHLPVDAKPNSALAGHLDNNRTHLPVDAKPNSALAGHLDADRVDLPTDASSKQDLDLTNDAAIIDDWFTHPSTHAEVTHNSSSLPPCSPSAASSNGHMAMAGHPPSSTPDLASTPIHEPPTSPSPESISASISHHQGLMPSSQGSTPQAAIISHHQGLMPSSQGSTPQAAIISHHQRLMPSCQGSTPQAASISHHQGLMPSCQGSTPQAAGAGLWMEPRQLCRLLRTCSAFGMRPSWLLDLTQQLLVHHPNAFSSWTLCRLAGSLALLEVDDVKVFQQIIALLHPLCGGNMAAVLPPAALAQLLRAHITLQDLTGHQLLSDSDDRGLLAACTKAALERRRRSTVSTPLKRSFVPAEIRQVTAAIHAVARRKPNASGHGSLPFAGVHPGAASCGTSSNGSLPFTDVHPGAARISSTAVRHASDVQPGEGPAAAQPCVAGSIPAADTPAGSSVPPGHPGSCKVERGAAAGQFVVERPAVVSRQGSIPVRGGLFEVDAVVRYAGSEVAVVVHLPQHFTRTQPPQLVGFEQWRLHRLQGEFDGRVVTVPWFEVAGMDEEDMRLCLQHYLDECVMSVAA